MNITFPTRRALIGSAFLMLPAMAALAQEESTQEKKAAKAKQADENALGRLEAIESKLDSLFEKINSIEMPAKPESKGQKESTVEKPATAAKKEEPKKEKAKKESEPEFALKSEWLKQLPWRSIGPANMSGRITDLAILDDDPSRWWVATGGGGLLKSTNHGVTMEHQFDHETTVSIGAICPDPNNKDVLWVGTGEANPRNSVSYGDGVYKSTDGGKTWEHMGLKETYQIGRIIVHPEDSNTVFVGALGRLYGPNRERGVFKTTDGGKTWEQSLYVDDNTGVIDMIMDPNDPDTVIAALWDRERDEFDSWPGSVKKPEGIDGYDPIRKWGPGAGLYKTKDGGKNWYKLTAGLPTGMFGRVGLDWQRAGDNVIYAIIDCEDIGKGPQPFSAYLGLVGINKDDKAIITQVMPESPAAKEGIKVGDILTTVEGKEIKEFDDLLAVLRKKKIGQKISFSLLRGEEKIDVTTKLLPRPGSREPVPTVWLGVTGKDGEGDEEMKKILLESISKGGPAEKAGLKKGDEIVKAQGKSIESYSKLIETVRAMSEGEKLKLDLLRGEKEVSVEVVIENRPGQRAPTSRAIMGIQGENAKDTGARMLSITDGGPSAKAGMKAGDVVIKVAGEKIANYDALIAEIRKRQPNDKMKVTILRDKKEKELEVKLGDRNASSSTRPYTYSYFGQQPNIQDMQGSEGSKFGGIYKSTDAGETWERVNSLNTRPMYFSVIRVDPNDDQRVYVLGVSQFVSTNGGTTFQSNFGRGVHSDSHDLWIDPSNGKHMVIGGDGGVYVTYDYGQNWDHINTKAIGQFYHVAISPKQPYWVVGGLQDNGSWAGPAISLSGGAVNQDWVSVGGGDGFICRVDQDDPDLMYYESQNGNIARRHLKTGARASIRPPRKQGVEYRFNWETPFLLSSHNQKIFYSAGNYVFRSYDRGNNLKTISPEITRTKRGSASDLSESPIDPNVLYVGTDDGALWVTKDGGTKWKNITENLNAPGPRWVATVEASRFEAGRVYVALDGHRSDDDNPYAYVSDDFGETFKPLHRDLPRGSTRCLREDIVNPNLLYLGTEFGFFVTVDRGQHWTQCNQVLPSVAIHDVAIHPTNGEIVLATHGRSLWACDISVLRGLDAQKFAKAPAFYKPQEVVRWRSAPRRGRTNRAYVGSNPPRGAQLWYSLPKAAKEVKLQISDISGNVISELNGETKPGLYRTSWNMTQTARRSGQQRGIPAGFRGGARPVPTGSYQVALVVDKKTIGKQVIQLVSDPTLPSDAVADEVYELELQRDEMASQVKSKAKKDGVDVYQDN